MSANSQSPHPVLTIRLPRLVLDQLRARAAAEQRTANNLARRFIAQALAAEAQ